MNHLYALQRRSSDRLAATVSKNAPSTNHVHPPQYGQPPGYPPWHGLITLSEDKSLQAGLGTTLPIAIGHLWAHQEEVDRLHLEILHVEPRRNWYDLGAPSFQDALIQPNCNWQLGSIGIMKLASTVALRSRRGKKQRGPQGPATQAAARRLARGAPSDSEASKESSVPPKKGTATVGLYLSPVKKSTSSTSARPGALPDGTRPRPRRRKGARRFTSPTAAPPSTARRTVGGRRRPSRA